jgi:hypothetical protein
MKVFKVVTPSMHSIFAGGRWRLTYCVGETTTGHGRNSLVFSFNSVEAARLFAHVGDRVLQCSTVGTVVSEMIMIPNVGSGWDVRREYWRLQAASKYTRYQIPGTRGYLPVDTVMSRGVHVGRVACIK